MKNYIRHIVSESMEEVLEKSYLHCHCKGVHSIMLNDSPLNKLRLYVAVEGNGLHRNAYGKKLSIGFHPHHCNISLHVIKGELYNRVAKVLDGDVPEDHSSHSVYTRWMHRSHIREGDMGFKEVGRNYLKELMTSRKLGPGDDIHMNADTVHTVSAHADEVTAWFVYEGKENPEYVPHLWNNLDLSNEVGLGLYKKPQESDVLHLLHLVNLL